MVTVSFASVPMPNNTPCKQINESHPRHAKGYRTASFDKAYGGPMDFLKSSGFTSDGCNFVREFAVPIVLA